MSRPLLWLAVVIAFVTAMALGLVQIGRHRSARALEMRTTRADPPPSRAGRRGGDFDDDSAARLERRREEERVSVIASLGAPTSASMDVHARALLSLYDEWDDGVYRALFPLAPPAEALQERIEWLRTQLGECGVPTPMPGNPRRFDFACERGHLEAELMPDPDRPDGFAGLRMGSRDVAPPEIVRASAQTVLELMRAWDEARYLALFSSTFEDAASIAEFRAVGDRLGICAIVGVQIASARGAIFDIDCDPGHATSMKIELDDTDAVGQLLLDVELP